MNKKIVGVVFLIVGVAAMIWGYNVYDSASSQITRALNGDTPIEAWVGMIGGAISIAIGVMNIK